MTSIVSGQLISRWGRYRLFPVAGTAIMALGLFLLSRMDAETSIATASLNMLVMGLGLGMVMQVLVIAVQNAVEYRDLGVATSGTTLFRLVGGSLGTAVFGAIFASRLARHLAEAQAGGAGATISPQMLERLSSAERAVYVEAFTASTYTVFLVATGVALVGFAFTWLVPERPLRGTVAALAEDVGREAEDLFPLPTDASSLLRLERALSRLADRDTRRDYARAVAQRAGLDTGALGAWLLVRIAEHPGLDAVALGHAHWVPRDRVEEATVGLRDDGLVEETGGADGARRWSLTPAGAAALDGLLAARREHLQEVLVRDWGPAGREALAAVLGRFTRPPAPEGRAGTG